MENKNFVVKLLDYQKTVRKWCKIMKSNRYSLETNTMMKIILPLFELLGWNSLSDDMEFEYPVTEKGKKLGRVDIALYVNDSKKPKILVEVKRLQQEKLGAGTQLFKYLKAKNINYGVYTNGNEFILIDKRYTKPQYHPHKMLVIRLLDKPIDKYAKVLTAFSKTSIKKGRLDALVKEFRQKYSKTGYLWRDYNKRLEFARNFLGNIYKK